jgi:hypothetical protein
MGELAIEAPSYWERRWVFLLEVPMDDLNDPRISAYKPQRRLLLPAPPGYRSRPSKAQRRQRRQRKARAEARIARFHLVGMTGAGVIVMGCLAAAAVVVVLVLLVSHH